MINRTRVIVAGIAVCAVLFAVPSLAVDGEILINQAKVNAGGITPGDDAGFPATLSRSGRYKLSGNLVVPAGTNGIEVTAQDVTIDLNGFTIRSNPAGQALNGVYAQYIDGLTVMNGTITGFGSDGIQQFVGKRGVVENMRIVSNGYRGVYMSVARIRNSTIANNGYEGVTCGGCLIEQNVITGNTSAGIHGAEGTTVIGNVLVSNGYVGMFSTGGAALSSGYGSNVLVGNFSGGVQAAGNVIQLHPNACEPACP
jgi:hypothetical protein